MKERICLVLALLATCLLSSCQMTETERLEHLLQEWNGKEIVFPKNPSFTVSFKADRPEHFNKNIIIHSNTDDSPHVLWVKGQAKN